MIDNHPPRIVSREQWLEQRVELLRKEKEFTRSRDELTRQRQALPWVKVDKAYEFIGVDGKLRLLDLFADCRQLMIYHFMYGADWKEGCKSCAFWADNFNGIDVHLAQRDISFLAVSSAPLSALQSFAKRFNWSFRWLSVGDSTFNQDFGVTFDETARQNNQIHYNYKEQGWFTDELPGISVFVRDENDSIYHTYSTYARGVDMLNGAYNYMDLAPMGRNEDDGMSWLRLRDEYSS